MTQLIKHIQNTLEHGRLIDIKTGPVAEQVLKEIQKLSQTLEKKSSSKNL